MSTREEVVLGGGNVAFVDREDMPLVSCYNWHEVEIFGNIYASCTIKSKTVLMHRMIMKAPYGLVVDHRDKNGLNNQKYNLRLCTQSQNMAAAKMKNTNTSGYRGVSKHGSGWKATITVRYKQYVIGTFRNKEDAARAYDKWAKELYGEFANLNFPESS